MTDSLSMHSNYAEKALAYVASRLSCLLDYCQIALATTLIAVGRFSRPLVNSEAARRILFKFSSGLAAVVRLQTTTPRDFGHSFLAGKMNVLKGGAVSAFALLCTSCSTGGASSTPFFMEKDAYNSIMCDDVRDFSSCGGWEALTSLSLLKLRARQKGVAWDAQFSHKVNDALKEWSPLGICSGDALNDVEGQLEPPRCACSGAWGSCAYVITSRKSFDFDELFTVGAVPVSLVSWMGLDAVSKETLGRNFVDAVRVDQLISETPSVKRLILVRLQDVEGRLRVFSLYCVEIKPWSKSASDSQTGHHDSLRSNCPIQG